MCICCFSLRHSIRRKDARNLDTVSLLRMAVVTKNRYFFCLLHNLFWAEGRICFVLRQYTVPSYHQENIWIPTLAYIPGIQWDILFLLENVLAIDISRTGITIEVHKYLNSNLGYYFGRLSDFIILEKYLATVHPCNHIKNICGIEQLDFKIF